MSMSLEYQPASEPQPASGGQFGTLDKGAYSLALLHSRKVMIFSSLSEESHAFPVREDVTADKSHHTRGFTIAGG